jgi:hypothetical protein
MGLVFAGMSVYGFPVWFMTGGFLVSIFYFEINKQNQFYFYFNKGLSKYHLYSSSALFNTLLSIAFLYLIDLCKTFLKLIV